MELNQLSGCYNSPPIETTQFCTIIFNQYNKKTAIFHKRTQLEEISHENTLRYTGMYLDMTQPRYVVIQNCVTT